MTTTKSENKSTVILEDYNYQSPNEAKPNNIYNNLNENNISFKEIEEETITVISKGMNLITNNMSILRNIRKF